MPSTRISISDWPELEMPISPTRVNRWNTDCLIRMFLTCMCITSLVNFPKRPRWRTVLRSVTTSLVPRQDSHQNSRKSDPRTEQTAIGTKYSRSAGSTARAAGGTITRQSKKRKITGLFLTMACRKERMTRSEFEKPGSRKRDTEFPYLFIWNRAAVHRDVNRVAPCNLCDCDRLDTGFTVTS
jgi:hypothetical protein